MTNLLDGKSMTDSNHSMIKTFKYPFSVDATRRDFPLILSAQNQLGHDGTWFLLAFFAPVFYKALSLTFHLSERSLHKDLHRKAFHPYNSYNRTEIATAQLAFFLAIYTTDFDKKHYFSCLPISSEHHEELNTHLGDTVNMRRIANLTKPPQTLFKSLNNLEESQDPLLSFIRQRKADKLQFQQERGWTHM